jgi:hypothetical protein
MGYRSEIIAGVPVKDKKKALSIIDKWDYTAESKVRHWGTNTNQYTYFYMKANAWKWYDHPIGDGYEKVVAFRKFIEEDEENRFIVGVGEEGETYPDTGDWHEHDIYIHTTIDDDSIPWDERI